MGWLIRVGEFLKFRKCAWDHMFVIGENGIVQATLKGVTDNQPINPKWEYVLVTPPCDVEKMMEFLEAQVGIKYSWLTILSIAFDILTWNWVPSLMNSYRPSWICSGLACESLRYGGWFHEWTNVYLVTPQQAFTALNTLN